MGKLGCSSDGYLNDSKFSEPMPWIGIYVAAASALCALAMSVDVVHAFRYRKFWFPCKFFSLNATSLTLIAVAGKLSVDLNTSMPRSQDQLAKLSSTVFICTIMGNFMPSLGTTEDKELLMNIMALGILVITAIANICIQLGTGVIYVFWKEHIFVTFMMLVLLAILCSSALAVPSTKSYLRMKYSKTHKVAVSECLKNNEFKQIRENLSKCWMMAHTCDPQFVVGRLATCTASGAFCLLSAVTLAEAVLRAYLMPWSFKFCRGESEYNWSTTLILATQILGVGVGTIAPAARWFTAIKFRCLKKFKMVDKTEFEVEKYWIQKLVEWKERPLASQRLGRRGRRFVHNLKYQTLNFCIGMQSGIVLISKLVRLISIFFVGQLLMCWYSCTELKRFLKTHDTSSCNELESETQHRPEFHLSRYVVHLQGEEGLVHLMIAQDCDATSHWFEMGVKNQPKHLIQLLEKSLYSKELKGVNEFDSNQVPCLDLEEPPNSWALPVVTLTAIAVAIPNISHQAVKRLKYSVHEALVYIRVVENNLVDPKKDKKNSREAAEIVWLGIDLCDKWLDVNLRAKAREGKDQKDILEELSNVAKKKFKEVKQNDLNRCLSEAPSKWPINAMAANSMYRICQSILQDYQFKSGGSNEVLFEKLSVMISDIISACLTNLKHVITKHCNCSSIENKEDNVRYDVILLGQTEKIVKNLELIPTPGLTPDLRADIDHWRSLNNSKGILDYGCTGKDTSSDSFTLSDMHISIE
ncbi:Transmembrane protein [Heracleum sosnowskyi]|uniref:Transmembrane protein n=1 Tax=Heracleum sosnowskyi TaxID=360622 RepID=A0AAD8I432_9APIA|nr:Transmembrane protein [Heracleum sosnowskyi]